VEKLQYLLWTDSGRVDPGLSTRLRTEVATALAEAGGHRMTVDVADDDAVPVELPLPPPPDDPAPAALVSVWLQAYDFREGVEAALAGLGLRMAGYLVTESVYTEYGDNEHGRARDWPDGERSPGVVMLTCMEKPDRLSDEAWVAHWHGTQSPVSTRIQPRMRYVRNLVVRPLTPGGPPFRGIVEEAWPSIEHVNDPMLFYLADGSEDRLQTHLAEMLDSVTAFLDLDRLRCASMSEYLLSST
jgi:hypothetical protein